MKYSANIFSVIFFTNVQNVITALKWSCIISVSAFLQESILISFPYKWFILYVIIYLFVDLFYRYLSSDVVEEKI